MPVDDDLYCYDQPQEIIAQAIQEFLDIQHHNAVLVWQHDGCIFEPWDSTKVLSIRIAQRLRKAGVVK